MSESADRDDLTAILAKHQIINTGDMGTDLIATTCLCGEQLLNSYAGGAPIEKAEWHSAHVAQMVLQSDWLRGVRAKELRDAADAYPFNYRDPLAPGQWQVLCWLRDRANETRLCKCGHTKGEHNGDQKGCRALGPIGLGLGCDCSGRFQPPGTSANLLRDRADRVDAEDTDNTTDRT